MRIKINLESVFDVFCTVFLVSKSENLFFVCVGMYLDKDYTMFVGKKLRNR